MKKLPEDRVPRAAQYPRLELSANRALAVQKPLQFRRSASKSRLTRELAMIGMHRTTISSSPSSDPAEQSLLVSRGQTTCPAAAGDFLKKETVNSKPSSVIDLSRSGIKLSRSTDAPEFVLKFGADKWLCFGINDTIQAKLISHSVPRVASACCGTRSF